MAGFEGGEPPRASETFIKPEVVHTVQALQFAEELRDLDSRCSAIVLLQAPHANALPAPETTTRTRRVLIATSGSALDPAKQRAAALWLRSVNKTQVYSIPRELRGVLRAFRVLSTPIASPVHRYGVLALTRPVGELCPNQLRRSAEALAAEWALQLEQERRKSHRVHQTPTTEHWLTEADLRKSSSPPPISRIRDLAPTLRRREKSQAS